MTRRFPNPIIGYRKNGAPIYQMAGGAAGQTVSSGMWVPDVWADVIQRAFLGKLVLGANGFTVQDNRLVGNPGETVTFPTWGALSDMDDVDETTALQPEVFSKGESSEATIKEAGKAVEVTDKALLVAFGDPMAEIRRQLGVLVARKIDADLKVAAETSTLTSDGSAGVISWDSFVTAAMLYGDQWAPEDFAGLVVHSAVYGKLLVDPNFISADKMGARGLPIPTGSVGVIGGVPIYVSDRVTVAAGPPATYTNLLIRRNALGLLYKRRPIVETDRDILARSNVITTNVHYAVKLLQDGNDGGTPGVVKFVTQ